MQLAVGSQGRERPRKSGRGFWVEGEHCLRQEEQECRQVLAVIESQAVHILVPVLER